MDLKNEKFYDQINSFYDDMIVAKKSENRKLNLFKEVFENYSGRAADLGCGSGIDSFSLASNGFDVNGFDPSEKMIKSAKNKYSNSGLPIIFHNYAIDNVPAEFDTSFDLVVSLGNTFANIPTNKLEISLKRIFDILKSGGSAFLQIVNYTKIMQSRERILNITATDTETFVRFYDFLEEGIRFNILNFKTENNSDYNLNSTILYPHSTNRFTKLSEKIGFSKISFFSDLKENTYEANNSSNLIVKLTREIS